MPCRAAVALGGIIVSVTLCACAHTETSRGFADVQSLTSDRIGQRVHWYQGTAEDAAVADTIRSLLSEELTAQSAVQVALLKNPALQATFEELGITQADLVQAGLLKNPVFLASARFPDRPPSSTNLEFAVIEDFLDVFMRPLRKEMAGLQFEQAQLRVADAVLELSAKTKQQFYTLQGEQEVARLQQPLFEAADAALDLARRQHAVGNIDELDLGMHESACHAAKIELMHREAQVVIHRERLNRLMGLSGDETDWKLADSLPELPLDEEELQALLDRADSQRLDLQAARKETEIIEQAIKLTRGSVLGAVEIGVDTERETDETVVTGPTLQLGVPIFDHGQARRARQQAQLRQSRYRIKEMELIVASEVRSAYTRLSAARTMAEYCRNEVVPLRTRMVSLSQQYYDAMIMGAYALLKTKENEVRAQRQYTEALADYWIARSEVERAVGGSLKAEIPLTPAPMPVPRPEMEMPQPHHHGGHE
ncbi:MAG: TolC family protein [Candidatus Abyssobacteria bacterium SURF_17]|uniref:TolC family protein n=1 Tax=Candidatus Abyssobacteria bacterium SURF_17 TaxID=2093361 RepID=A0A419F8Y2_9BACT|nr:MAG: TolC family protein [Candidatus Abyssubacteria bacterium SURF_17]